MTSGNELTNHPDVNRADYLQMREDNAAHVLRLRRTQRIADIIMVILGMVALGFYVHHWMSLDKETFKVWTCIALLVFFAVSFVNFIMRIFYYGALSPEVVRRYDVLIIQLLTMVFAGVAVIVTLYAN